MVAESSSAPSSWAADLNSYRSAVGSRSYAALDQTSTPPRYVRTNMVPMGQVTHPLYSQDEFRDGPGADGLNRAHSDRMRRHGYGDVSLLQPDTAAPSGRDGVPQPAGRRRVGSPKARDGRDGMFGVIAMTEQGQKDSWIGHPQVDPSKGKRPVVPPQDPKGRRDLFDVLHARAPGKAADDSWLGHIKVDPARGKLRPPGPEELRGRSNGLQPIISQQVLREEHRLDLLTKGADPLGDAWCGNRLIDPARGKGTAGEGVAAAEEALRGATFKQPAGPDHSDLPRRHRKVVEPAVAPSAPQVMNGTATGDDWGNGGRRNLPPPAPHAAERSDLYAHMTYRPLSEPETSKYSKAWDDSGARGKLRNLPIAGTHDDLKGPDMLQWRPEIRLTTHVPRGGLAQTKKFFATNKNQRTM